MQLMASRSSESSAEANAYVVVERSTQKIPRNTEGDLYDQASRFDGRAQGKIKKLSKEVLLERVDGHNFTESRMQQQPSQEHADSTPLYKQTPSEQCSIIENYATGDAIQFMISTDGRTIHGSNRGLGRRTWQIGDHLSDSTVLQLSRDLSSFHAFDLSDDVSSIPNEADSTIDDMLTDISGIRPDDERVQPKVSDDGNKCTELNKPRVDRQ